MSLAPCPSCQRHIRVGESACPFCGALITATQALRAVPGTTQRLSRAAAFVFTATLSVAGCGDDGGVMALYGAPAPVDSGGTTDDRATPTDTASTRDTGGTMPGGDGGVVRPDAGMATDTGTPQDDGTVVALYGAPVDRDAGQPVRDAGSVRDIGPVRDSGGVVPLYGAPVDRDAGPPNDEGTVMALYGAVPADAGFEEDDTRRDGGAIGVRYGGPVRFDGG